MTIKTIKGTNIQILGNIKSHHDYETIKIAITSIILENKIITIDIPDSISITSSVIGYLNKIISKDKINIRLKVGNESLFGLLDDLHLVRFLNVSLNKFN